MSKYTPAKSRKKIFVQAVSYLEFKDYRANSVDPDEEAHYEPPLLDIRYLQIQMFWL